MAIIVRVRSKSLRAGSGFQSGNLCMIKFVPMFLRRYLRPQLARLLLAVMLLQTLLPAWAALHSNPSDWVEICASSGVKWVKTSNTDGKQDSSARQALHEHCVLCAATGAKNEFDVTPYLLTSLCCSQPAAGHTQNKPLAFPGHSLQSRAPPFFS